MMFEHDPVFIIFLILMALVFIGYFMIPFITRKNNKKSSNDKSPKGVILFKDNKELVELAETGKIIHDIQLKNHNHYMRNKYLSEVNK